MKILTGNDLTSGAVVWWDGSDWSLHIDDAVDAGDEADGILARESAARRVNAAYAVDGQRTDAKNGGASARAISRNASARSARPCASTSR